MVKRTVDEKTNIVSSTFVQKAKVDEKKERIYSTVDEYTKITMENQSNKSGGGK